MTSPRHLSIEWLRAIAALMVVAHHATFLANDLRAPGTAALGHGVPALPSFGAAGVDLFFVISGFVLAQSVAGPREIGTIDFLLRRAVRILPVFWLASGLFLVEALPHDPAPTGLQLLNTLTLFPLFDPTGYAVPPLYVGWTLGFEWLFYMLVAAVVATRARPRIPLLVGLTTVLAAAGLLHAPGPAWSHFLFNPILGEFTLGLLCWLAWRRGIPARWAGALTVTGVLLLASGLVIDVGQGFGVNVEAVVGGEASLRRLLVWGVPAALLLAGLVASPAEETRRTRWLTTLGGASYMLYLVHLIVMKGVIHLRAWLPTSHAPVCAALIVLASVAAALLLHRFVERPLLRRLQPWAKRTAARWSGPAVLPQAAA